MILFRYLKKSQRETEEFSVKTEKKKKSPNQDSWERELLCDFAQPGLKEFIITALPGECLTK